MNQAKLWRLEDLGHDIDAERVNPRFDHDVDATIMQDGDSVTFTVSDSAGARIEADNNVVLGDYE